MGVTVPKQLIERMTEYLAAKYGLQKQELAEDIFGILSGESASDLEGFSVLVARNADYVICDDVHGKRSFARWHVKSSFKTQLQTRVSIEDEHADLAHPDDNRWSARLVYVDRDGVVELPGNMNIRGGLMSVIKQAPALLPLDLDTLFGSYFDATRDRLIGSGFIRP